MKILPPSKSVCCKTRDKLPVQKVPGGFTLLEVIMAVLLVGTVLSMIMGAVVLLDSAVANEHVMVFKDPANADLKTSWGYWGTPPNSPVFSLAPSRACDAQAELLWKQMLDLYEQSGSVAIIDKYLIHDFDHPVTDDLPFFMGKGGFLVDKDAQPYAILSYADLTSNQSQTVPQNARLLNLLINRFPNLPANNYRGFHYWGDDGVPYASTPYTGIPANVDLPSLRCMTIFFLAAPQDRILGILRARAWQFTSATGDPYRYYEVSLTRLRWVSTGTGATASWMLPADNDNTNPVFAEKYGYRFVEDRRYPQDLIYPPTETQLADIALGTTTTSDDRNRFFRLAFAGEDYNPTGGDWANNTNPRVSRRQVSLAPVSLSSGAAPVLTSSVSEWHVILPDPSLNQAEIRLKFTAAAIKNTVLRQGKYGCVLSVYP